MKTRMHADEVDIDTALVRQLLSAQFPRWAELPIEPVPSSGTDNAMFRLGDRLAVRLPRIPSAAEQVSKEYQWLPKLGPGLPLATPMPIALGVTGEGYPWNWSVCEWLDGESATVQPVTDQQDAAKRLASFIKALQRIDASNGPSPGPHNSFRGEPLTARDARTRDALQDLRDVVDLKAAIRVWDMAVGAPGWQSAPVWIHGDLQAGNLLVQEGRLSAVIDFGTLGVGDPACDLIVAWNFLSRETRKEFRTMLAIDDATWARGRGWALSVALIAIPYYRHTNPTLTKISLYAVSEVLADVRRKR
jgi:aminoglycoside phosphotransferase (APT) family kinase protein